MKRFTAVVILLAVLTACSDSPSSPGGTLPIVQNCRIIADESKGDTVTVAWDPLDVEVDGYRVWYADTDPGNWNIIAQVEETTTQHIASRTGYYCVEALKGIDTSEDQSNKANNRASMYMIDDTLMVGGNNGIAFYQTHTALGDASSPGFEQDLYMERQGDTILFYRGNFEPAVYPAGRNSMIALSSNFLAPGPEDEAWKNTIAVQEGRSYFVKLESGYYAMFSVDTVFDDWVILNSSQFQPILGLRLFNHFIF